MKFHSSCICKKNFITFCLGNPFFCQTLLVNEENFVNFTFIFVAKNNWTFFRKFKLHFSKLAVTRNNEKTDSCWEQKANRVNTRNNRYLYNMMFKLMFLPHQIMWKMNELFLKIDLTTMAYFANIRSKVGGLFCQLLPTRVIFFQEVIFLSICKIF